MGGEIIRYIIWSLLVLAVLALAIAISTYCCREAQAADNASVTIYFTHVGEDCPAGGPVTSLVIGWSLTMPPDTTNPIEFEECPNVPTPQDQANAVWWDLSSKTFVPVKDPGTPDSLVVTGLPYDTDIWFGARAEDEAGNNAPLVVRMTRTTVAPDTLSPEAVDFWFFR